MRVTWLKFSMEFHVSVMKPHRIFLSIDIWASSQENLSSGFAKNTGADQPAHPRSLISAFVIRILESIIGKIAAG